MKLCFKTQISQKNAEFYKSNAKFLQKNSKIHQKTKFQECKAYFKLSYIFIKKLTI